jgi:virginiamycin B lyase
MSKRVYFLVTGITFASLLLAFPKDQPRVALTGIVSSDAEGAMEGVLISAKRGTITVTVVSDKEGRYSFPASRLTRGEYQLSIRAVGYEAANPNLTATVDKGTSAVAIKLKRTQDLASQLTDAEWLMSIPGTHEQKDALYRNCVLCHTLAPVMKSQYDAAGWMTTLVRMRNWSNLSTLSKPILSRRGEAPDRYEDGEFAKYLGTINLSSRSKMDFEFKTLPRPHGEDTKVIVTEYDLPRPDSQPHDVVMDAGGMAWYCDFMDGIVGRLNPLTGEVKEWQDPEVKPGYPGGFQQFQMDPEGNLWLTRHEFPGFAEFFTKDEKFVNWSVPPEYSTPRTITTFLAVAPDKTIWVKDEPDRKVFRFNPATGNFTAYNQYPPDVSSKERHGTYGVNTDSKGNEYSADKEGSSIVKIDAQTGKSTLYATPTPDSGPRRMHTDSEDRLWIGEYYASKIAMFDTRSGKFQEWPHPIPYYGPYDAVLDKAGYVWTGSMSTDLVTRLDPRTGEFRMYLLPHLGANIRRVDVDNSTTPPIFWVGENHQAKIAKVEPLD